MNIYKNISEIDTIIQKYDKNSGLTINDNSAVWKLYTSYGTIKMTIFKENSKISSIFMMFKDFTNIPMFDNVNQFSGKWNIHQFTILDAIVELKRRLNILYKGVEKI